MKNRRIIIFTMIVLLGFTLLSCSQKFPKPISTESGMLVIAHKSINKTKWNFAYRYVLNYLPDSRAEIKIMPNTSSYFIMIDDFPVGEYWISGVTTIGMQTGTTTPRDLRHKQTINGDSFEIKPNQVTLLDSRFVILNKMIKEFQTRQTWKLESLDQKSKKEIINELKKLENSEFWSFAD